MSPENQQNSSSGRIKELQEKVRDLTSQLDLLTSSNSALKYDLKSLAFLNDHVSDVITRFSIEGKCLYVSPSAKRILGYDPEQLTGISNINIVHPEDAHIVTDISYKELFQTGKCNNTARHRKADGTYIWLETASSLVRDENGDPTDIVCVSRDVHDRVIKEELLAKSEEQYRVLINNMPAGFAIEKAVYNPQGQIYDFTYLQVNPAFEKITGLSACDIVGRNVRDLYPDLEQYWFDNLAAVVRTGRPAEFEQYAAPFDKYFSIHAFRPMPRHVAFVITDVTHRRETEKKLSVSEEHFRSIFENSPLGIGIVDAGTFKIIQANDAYCNLLGYTHEQLLEKNIEDLTYGPDWQRELNEISALKDKGSGSYSIEKRIIKSDGSYLWVMLTATVVSSYQGHLLGVGIIEDITERKKNFQQLKKLNTTLQEKNRELQDFVYITSHDLRTPIVNIRGFANELKSGCQRLDQILQDSDTPADILAEVQKIVNTDIIESLHFIDASTRSLNSLLDGLLKVSRITTAEVNPVNIDLDQLVGDIISAMNYEISRTGVKISRERLLPCKGDPVQIGQVFSNLISNAIKYKSDHRPCNIHISSRRVDVDNMVLYCVQDNGIGIEPEMLEKIFTIFYRIQTSDAVPGDGLGLTIVKRIIEKHGGSIRAESEPGQGSNFKILLPGIDN